MRVYFLSCRTAALKINGEYLGIIDGVERFVELPQGAHVLAEVIPKGAFAPVHFFIDDELFAAPPPFLNVYLLGNETLIHITQFESLLKELKVLSQVQLGGALVTEFCEGGRLYVSVNGETCSLYTADPHLINCPLESAFLGREEVALLSEGGRLMLFSQGGKLLFDGKVLNYNFGERLSITHDLGGCERYFAECRYEYFNGELRCAERAVKRRLTAKREVLHFAFFERILHKCDFEQLLHPSLKPKADLLGEYLCEFTGVMLPPESFYSRREKGNFCGLIYPVKQNLFSVKYFEVSFDGDLIDNIAKCEH